MKNDRSIKVPMDPGNNSTPAVRGESADSDTVLAHRVDGVEVLTLNRPEKLNAWTVQMRSMLAEHIRRCSEDPFVKAVVLTGAGNRGFCVGQDFNESLDSKVDADGAELVIEGIERFYGRVRTFDKPLVAALNGVAAGSGFQVALLCDVRIAHPAVRLGQPEVNSGMPSVVGPYLMTSVLGASRTAELVLSGRFMTATEALGAGVLHDVVAPESVLNTAVARAAELVGQPPGAFAATKAWLRTMTEDGLREAFRTARRVNREAFASGEPQRGMEHFLATRPGRTS